MQVGKEASVAPDPWGFRSPLCSPRERCGENGVAARQQTNLAGISIRPKSYMECNAGAARYEQGALAKTALPTTPTAARIYPSVTTTTTMATNTSTMLTRRRRRIPPPSS